MFWGLWAPLILGIGSLYRFKQLKKLDMIKLKTSTVKRRKLSMGDESLTYGPEPQSMVGGEEEENAMISEYLA